MGFRNSEKFISNSNFYAYSKNPCWDALFLHSPNRPLSWNKLATVSFQMQMTWSRSNNVSTEEPALQASSNLRLRKWKWSSREKMFVFSKHHPYLLCYSQLHVWITLRHVCMRYLYAHWWSVLFCQYWHFSHFIQGKKNDMIINALKGD